MSKGTCTALKTIDLVATPHKTIDLSDKCDSKILIIDSDGSRTGVNFMANGGSIRFSGNWSGAVKQGYSLIDPIDLLTMTSPKGKTDDATAVGFCRVDNLDSSRKSMTCHAETNTGTYDAKFEDNGEPPETKRF